MPLHSPALVTIRRVAAPRYRLFCFPYAGGNAAAFAPWARFAPPDVELFAVQYKGRATRQLEAPSASIAEMVDDLLPAVAAIAGRDRRPFVFFGHSMGTAVAFELARKLKALGAPAPARLFLSARRSPHLAPLRQPIHHLPDDEFVDSISRMNGTPAQVLDNKELMGLLVPTLRADFRAVDSWSCDPARDAVDIPLTLFGGKADPMTPAEDLQAWSCLTTAGAEMRLFHGGHFYLRQHYPVLLKAIDHAVARG